MTEKICKKKIFVPYGSYRPFFQKFFRFLWSKWVSKNSVWTTDINFNDDNLQDPPIKYCTVGGLVLIITVYS